MNASQQSPNYGPPKFITALVAGFNIAASKAYLLLLPVALDCLLWFGPHFSLKTLFLPVIQEVLTSAAATGPDAASMVTAMRQIWEIILDHFNLLSLLSSLPVGIPSLMASIMPNENPLGQPLTFETSGWSQAFSGWLLFSLLGLLLGGLYFGLIARATTPTSDKISFARVVWEVIQVFSLTVMLLILVFILSVPVFLFAALVNMMSPGLAQIAIILCCFLLLWLLMPLIFTPHGIFIGGQNAFRSMLISSQLVRSLFPGVTLFLLSGVVLSQGLGYLWRMPPESSWLMLAGIFGNAFIGTGLLAASFVYYRSASVWLTRQRQEALLNSRIKL